MGKNSDSQWLNRTLTANDNGTSNAIICVDGRPDGVYRYMVIVDGVGEIDPRVDVGELTPTSITQ